MMDPDDEQLDVEASVVLPSDNMSLSRPGRSEAGTNPFARLVRGRQPGRLGDILMKMGRITLDQLQKGVDLQEKQPDKKLGEVLVDMGYINPQVVEQALHQQEQERVQAGELPPPPPVRKPQIAPRWKTDNQVRIWDRRLDT